MCIDVYVSTCRRELEKKRRKREEEEIRTKTLYYDEVIEARSPNFKPGELWCCCGENRKSIQLWYWASHLVQDYRPLDGILDVWEDFPATRRFLGGSGPAIIGHCPHERHVPRSVIRSGGGGGDRSIQPLVFPFVRVHRVSATRWAAMRVLLRFSSGLSPKS